MYLQKESRGRTGRKPASRISIDQLSACRSVTSVLSSRCGTPAVCTYTCIYQVLVLDHLCRQQWKHCPLPIGLWRNFFPMTPACYPRNHPRVLHVADDARYQMIPSTFSENFVHSASAYSCGSGYKGNTVLVFSINLVTHEPIWHS